MASYGEYSELFKRFFSTGRTYSSYKCVFLYALTDIARMGERGLAGEEWLSETEDGIILNLDFIAIRFAKYYWEVSDLDINHTRNQTKAINSKRLAINVFATINKEKSLHVSIPSLKELASPATKSFRSEILKKSIKPEVLKNLKTDFPDLYENDHSRSNIRLRKDIICYLKMHGESIRHRLQIKLKDHLERANPKRPCIEFAVGRENPFYEYLNSCRAQAFLIGVDLPAAMQDFERTAQRKVTLKRRPGSVDVSVWGMRATVETEAIWEKIRRGDTVLFSNGGKCFAQGTVWQTAKDANEARDLWGADYNEIPRELLIIMDDLTPISLDLEASRIPLIKPMIPEAYHFPIIKVDDILLNLLIVQYGGLKDALKGMSEPLAELEIRNVSVTMDGGKARIRHGQAAFRRQVLQNYGEKCAVCGISKPDLLEAAHILPAGNLDSAGDIRNGMCLCALHHKMFDCRYMCFDNARRLVFAKAATQDIIDTCTKTQITESDCTVLPSEDYLEKYYNIFQHTQELGQTGAT